MENIALILTDYCRDVQKPAGAVCGNGRGGMWEREGRTVPLPGGLLLCALEPPGRRPGTLPPHLSDRGLSLAEACNGHTRPAVLGGGCRKTSGHIITLACLRACRDETAPRPEDGRRCARACPWRDETAPRPEDGRRCAHACPWRAGEMRHDPFCSLSFLLAPFRRPPFNDLRASVEHARCF